MTRNVLLIISLAFVAGCETEVKTRVNVKSGLEDYSYNPDEKRITKEQRFLDGVEKDPQDAQAWFSLGEYYESALDMPKAAQAYERGNSLMTPGRYTGGHYLLARVYLRMQDWQASIAHLNEIFKLEPKDPKAACLNQHFREAHYLRGAIFYLNQQYGPAKHEFLRFIEIGGDENRVEDWLEQIRLSGE
jgi:tetratricopeptide (TPR) repeat protein